MRQESILSCISHSQYWLGRWDESVDDLYLDRLYDYDGPLCDLVYLLPADRRLIIVQTGIYGFDLPITVEIHREAPKPSLDAWDEAAELSAYLDRDTAVVSSLDGRDPLDLALPSTGPYRVRLHTRGRAEGEEVQHVSASDADDLVERHLLQIWPSPVTEDVWLKPPA